MSNEPIDLSAAKPRRATCAICGKPQIPQFKPFCSSRCADIDLGRWLNESYRVPVAAADEDAEEATEKSARED
ncbi:MAG TPA: DNA gyrase inhibitor YacG [Azospirillaceae bacterium]|nr:DNA gyrase inhibitor YacG [Azospirillaceae bacterium]